MQGQSTASTAAGAPDIKMLLVKDIAKGFPTKAAIVPKEEKNSTTAAEEEEQNHDDNANYATNLSCIVDNENDDANGVDGDDDEEDR